MHLQGKFKYKFFYIIMKLFGALWSHPMLALRTTTVITYLNNLSCGNLATYTKVRLLILKLVYYVWIVQMSVRAVVVVQQDLTKEKVLAAFLPFNPMIVMLVRLFGSASLNASILSSFCLAGQGVIHLDYVFTALIKVPNLFGLIHFIVIGNGLHFEAFNARRLGGWPKPASTRPFWQLWRLPVDYVFLGSRIWRATAKTAAAAAPNTLAKNSTPAIAFKTFSQSVSRDNKLFPSTSTSSATSLRFSSLPPLISGSIYLSDSLRALVYVYSAAWEALTTIGITLACKCIGKKFERGKKSNTIVINLFHFVFTFKLNAHISAYCRLLLRGHCRQIVQQSVRRSTSSKQQ